MSIAAALTPDRLLDAAEAIVQSVGYAGLSFRDLAASVGIKSASVHYHYPTKADLGSAVARRYTDRLAAQLTVLEATLPPRRAFAGYIDIFRTVLLTDGRMCLCGMLAAEADAIPERVRREVTRFVEINLAWVTGLITAIGDAAPLPASARAVALFAALEGALLVARATGDGSVFDAIEWQLLGAPG